MSITTDPERLAQVAAQLGTAIRDRVRLPVIQPRDAAGLTMVLHAELDHAIEQRSAEAARTGLHIACSAGCSTCCVSPVLVPEGEAVTVAEWLRLPENAAVLAAFYRRYPAWRDALGPLIGKIHRASGEGEAAMRVVAAELKGAGAMCAFNAEGLCSIYEARPARCRRAHALDTDAHCGGTGQVKYFEHLLTEQTFLEQDPMREALHVALSKHPYELLCAAVHRLLDATISRNAPCPCGSGDKYKKCCGKAT